VPRAKLAAFVGKLPQTSSSQVLRSISQLSTTTENLDRRPARDRIDTQSTGTLTLIDPHQAVRTGYSVSCGIAPHIKRAIRHPHSLKRLEDLPPPSPLPQAHHLLASILWPLQRHLHLISFPRQPIRPCLPIFIATMKPVVSAFNAWSWYCSPP
jgi:hypothetical protein